jgi:hypothetical protein
MRMPVIFCLTALSALAQFRTIEVGFEGIGCASCIESLPVRLQRMRGVASAQIDTQKQILKVELTSVNRVRVEQVRDAIEQDGTKTIDAVVRVSGEVAQSEGKWILKLPGVQAGYEVAGNSVSSKLEAGTYVITGRIAKLRPDTGQLRIEATEIKRPVRD